MDYAEIEDAILTALAPLKTSLGLALESYGGQFSPDSFGQTLVNYPALFVCCSGLTSTPTNNDDRREIIVDIYVATRDLRGEKTARRNEAGAYAVINAARVQINRLAVLGAGRLVLNNERLLGYSKAAGLCVIQAEYAIKYNQSIAAERS